MVGFREKGNRSRREAEKLQVLREESCCEAGGEQERE